MVRVSSASHRFDVTFRLGVVDGIDSNVTVLGFEKEDDISGAVEWLSLACDLADWDDSVLWNADMAKHVMEVGDPVACVRHDLDINSDGVEISASVLRRELKRVRCGIEYLKLPRVAGNGADLVGVRQQCSDFPVHCCQVFFVERWEVGGNVEVIVVGDLFTIAIGAQERAAVQEPHDPDLVEHWFNELG